MSSLKFTIPLLDDDLKEKEETKLNSGSLFKAHRQQIRSNILSKSPYKKEVDNEHLQRPQSKTPDAISDSVKSTSSASDTVALRSEAKSAHSSSSLPKSCIEINVNGRAETKSGETSKLNGNKSADDLLHGKPPSSIIPGSPSKPGSVSKAGLLTVSSRQRGNPVLKFIRNVAWEFGDIIPDYVMGKAMCALYLSLRYHNLNPKYIHERLKQLGRSFDLRVLLVQVDVKDPHHALKELAKICILSDVTLIVAFSAEEVGRYLETYKAYENKPPDLIMEKTEANFLSQFTDCVTSTRKVNKTDAMTLLTTFGSFENMVHTEEEDLSLCPGFGPQKARRLHEVLNEPFLKTNKKLKLQNKQNKTGESKDPQPSTSDIS